MRRGHRGQARSPHTPAGRPQPPAGKPGPASRIGGPEAAAGSRAQGSAFLGGKGRGTRGADPGRDAQNWALSAGGGEEAGAPAAPPAPADLVEQRVQHADAEDAARGERQAEHEGQVGAVFPFPLQESGTQAGAHAAAAHAVQGVRAPADGRPRAPAPSSGPRPDALEPRAQEWGSAPPPEPGVGPAQSRGTPCLLQCAALAIPKFENISAILSLSLCF